MARVMVKDPRAALTRRELAILDCLYRHGRATASNMQKRLPGRSSYSTVRTQLRVLVRKGHVAHRRIGVACFYFPVVSKRRVRVAVLDALLRTYFDGSVALMVAAIVRGEARALAPQELIAIEELIMTVRKSCRAQTRSTL